MSTFRVWQRFVASACYSAALPTGTVASWNCFLIIWCHLVRPLSAHHLGSLVQSMYHIYPLSNCLDSCWRSLGHSLCETRSKTLPQRWCNYSLLYKEWPFISIHGYSFVAILKLCFKVPYPTTLHFIDNSIIVGRSSFYSWRCTMLFRAPMRSAPFQGPLVWVASCIFHIVFDWNCDRVKFVSQTIRRKQLVKEKGLCLC